MKRFQFILHDNNEVTLIEICDVNDPEVKTGFDNVSIDHDKRAIVGFINSTLDEELVIEWIKKLRFGTIIKSDGYSDCTVHNHYDAAHREFDVQSNLLAGYDNLSVEMCVVKSVTVWKEVK